MEKIEGVLMSNGKVEGVKVGMMSMMRRQGWSCPYPVPLETTDGRRQDRLPSTPLRGDGLAKFLADQLQLDPNHESKLNESGALFVV
jgi:hypothetical protein